MDISPAPNLLFLNIEQIQESPAPVLVELCFQKARGKSGEISPDPSSAAAGVGEALEQAPSPGVRTPCLSWSAPEVARSSGLGPALPGAPTPSGGPSRD